MTTDKSKLCCACKQEKPLSEFYVRRGKYPTSECKDCMNIRGKAAYKRDRTITHVPSETYIIKQLNHRGIPSLPGRALGYTFADVVSWGCVLIEVKTSKLVSGVFQWDFSERQMDRGLRADLIILICEWDDAPTHHIFDACDTKFYKDGRVKSGVTYTPHRSRSGRHSVFDEAVMNESCDRWDMIEQYRVGLSQSIANGDQTWLADWRVK
jgi:hypothetical protein